MYRYVLKGGHGIVFHEIRIEMDLVWGLHGCIFLLSQFLAIES